MQNLHGPETAGRLAARSIPIASKTDKVATVRGELIRGSHEIVELVVVTNDGDRYQGIVELRDILQAPGDKTIEALMRTDWPCVTPETDQEHAVEAAIQADVASLPVVARDGKPLGILSARVLLDVLAREHREDIHRIVGILHEREGAEHALSDPALQRAARRLPWLLVGLAMSVMAIGAMASFERVLAANITIAFFIPALVYLADAIGTQTEAIVVRGLSLRKLSLRQILPTEFATGALIGLALAMLAFFGVWLVFGSMVVGLGVGISLFIAGTLASSIGLLLPWMLSRVNIDPAFGSGPVATIVQDVLTILIYFWVMTVLLPSVA